MILFGLGRIFSTLTLPQKKEKRKKKKRQAAALVQQTRYTTTCVINIKLLAAKWEKKTSLVNLKIDAARVIADGLGNETPAVFDDVVDIVVFASDPSDFSSETVKTNLLYALMAVLMMVHSLLMWVWILLFVLLTQMLKIMYCV